MEQLYRLTLRAPDGVYHWTDVTLKELEATLASLGALNIESLTISPLIHMEEAS